jgi:hypothetical protein
VTSFDAKHLGCPSASKTDKNVDEMKDHSSETDESLSMKLLTCWGFYLGQFRASKRQCDHVSDGHQIIAPYMLTLLSVHQFLAKNRNVSFHILPTQWI